jgi:Domain of unknown function (DUF4263)
LAANPLSGSGQLSRDGLEWFAELVFGVDLAQKDSYEKIVEVLEKIQENNESLFKHAEFLKDLDINDPKNEKIVFERMLERQKTIEWWGYSAAVFCSIAASAVRTGDARTAAWAAANAERFRALTIFKQNFEEVVFMGHSAGRLIELIRVWDENRENSDERFWQITLGAHSYAFSQLFSVPVIFIGSTAYVGGTQLDGTDARYLDFMLAGGSVNHAILLEIKTPTARLLGGKYRRSVYVPSRELGGAVVQVNDYCDTLRRNVDQITRERKLELNTFSPRRVVLMGNYEKELTEPKLRSSFELFRSSLAGVEIVTFDEFFRKVEQLAKLFNLVRRATQAGG